MDLEKILEANGDLLFKRIQKLQQTTPGTEEDKNQLEAYKAIFTNYIAMMKLNEEATRNDNAEDLANRKLEQEKLQFEAKLELEREKLKSEKDISNDKVKLEREKLASEKTISDDKIQVEREKLNLEKILAESKKDSAVQIAIQAASVLGTILTPVACELIKQKMHWDVSKMVLTFEEKGVVTSSIGKAEFRK